MNRVFLSLTVLIFLASSSVFAEPGSGTNSIPGLSSSGPSAAVSVFRMIGALCLVFALLFAATWLYRNGARFSAGRGAQRKLHVLEARSLGGRQSVLVVAYDHQRFLIGTTPQGMTLLSHLPEAAEDAAPASNSIVALPFTDALMHALGRK